MASFTEIASRFYRLSLGKYKNGCSLNTVILFDAICHLASDELVGNEDADSGGVENANKKLDEMYGFKFNSATLSRNNTTLMELGLIRLSERATDRRYKDIMLTTKGHSVKKLMYQSGERVWKYN
tara:strand:+ start:283 stop:657 length:375 start_codon:yes stop_codon:yes gene_type:complete